MDYAAEIWDSPEHSDKLEPVMMKAAKKILHVPKRTHNAAVRSILGLCSLRTTRWKRKLMFWHRLSHMDDNRLPKCVFQNADPGLFKRKIKNISRRIGLNDRPQGASKIQWQAIIDSKLSDFEIRINNKCTLEMDNPNLALLTDYLDFDCDKRVLKPQWYFDAANCKSNRVRTNLLCSLTQCSEDTCGKVNTCPLCDTAEDSKVHWLIECDSLYEERKKVSDLLIGSTKEENLLILLKSKTKEATSIKN